MDGAPVIVPASPLDPDLQAMFERHLSLMRASSPPESTHALPAEALDSPEVAFFVLRAPSGVIAMGAIKRVDSGHGEIKSMHVQAEVRGQGHARRLLGHLIAQARASGYRRLSLETGAQVLFAPARALYLAEGFQTCPPFGGYREDPNSVFMTRGI